MTAWKRTERAVARGLGGERTSKAGLGVNAPDVETENWSIEVKHRQSLPVWLTEAMAQATRNASAGKLPLVVLHESGRRHADDLVMLRLGDFEAWFGDVPEKEKEMEGWDAGDIEDTALDECESAAAQWWNKRSKA